MPPRSPSDPVLTPNELDLIVCDVCDAAQGDERGVILAG
jgi:hypothetical protein